MQTHRLNRITLQLDGVCIETAAKRHFQMLTREALEVLDPIPALIERAELVRQFLEVTDFAALRAARPELDGRARLKVLIERRDHDFAVVVS